LKNNGLGSHARLFGSMGAAPANYLKGIRMEIQIDPHTLERAEERGASEEEIKDVISTGFSIPTKHGRMGKAKIYDFKQKRYNKYYEQKRVEVVYIVDRDVIITVTVYVFYGRWEEEDADSI